MKSSEGAMKAGSSTSPAVDIAPEALSHLADKLKLDLANDQRPKQSKRKRKGKEHDDKKNPPANGSQTSIRDIKPKKPEASQTSVSENKSTNRSPTNNFRSNESGKGKKSQAMQLQTPSKNTKRNQSSKKDMKEPSILPAAAKLKTTTVKKGGDNEKNQAASQGSSLLGEILALGGSKEDLELVEGVDSDEDIVGPAQNSKTRSNDKNVNSHFKSH
jgi:hypothetical protein